MEEAGSRGATAPRHPRGRQERGLAKRLHPVCPKVGLILLAAAAPFQDGSRGTQRAGSGVLPPSRPPALPGTMMGRCVLHKSSQGSG